MSLYIFFYSLINYVYFNLFVKNNDKLKFGNIKATSLYSFIL